MPAATPIANDGAGKLAGTNLNQVYEAIGALTAEVRGLRRDVQEDRKTASNYRAGVRKDIGDLVMRITHVEADMETVKRRSDEFQQASDTVKNMTAQAQGAGTLGHWLLKAGGWLLSAAAGAAAMWYQITGRPPP